MQIVSNSEDIGESIGGKAVVETVPIYIPIESLQWGLREG